MPSRTILSPAQRSAIFDPPPDQATIERLYTLGPDDLGQIARRRRGANRLGYAVQLCYLRHPGRSVAENPITRPVDRSGASDYLFSSWPFDTVECGVHPVSTGHGR